MSHFNVAVITDGTKTVHELLEPYRENNTGETKREYLEFYDTADEYREDYESGHIGMYFKPFDSEFRLLTEWSEELRVPGAIGFGTDTHKVPEGWIRTEIPYKVLFEDFDAYMRLFVEEEPDHETGGYGYWENPNAKWDWYIEIVSDEHDECWTKDYMGGSPIRISDIKFDPDKQYEEKLAWWNEYVSDDGRSKNFLDSLQTYGLEKEQFLEQARHLWFRAVVTPDGEWHEVGEMGWFAMSSETVDETLEWATSFEKRFIEPLDGDCVLHVVNCHV